ncbi:nitrate ABC transporter [Venatoribacter cucullus]|uniref:Nitrate ABC transporter n=1 Tax=Venatoribacter cucullus TaxID=2661630 RepID=A0A9X7YQ14_9GAMM|nr:ABC transporter substrate-binding protein [Venatoribacter cucullus]QQD25351.1 nitrate ABC transporter [Venatoribacter cucullus]
MLRLATLMITLLLTAALSACNHPSQPLRVGTNLWPGYELLYLAREQGYYDRHIKLVELPSASDVIDALRLGHLEAGALTLDEVLTLQQEGVDLVVVLVFNISMGADVLLTHPTVTGLSDLRGRTVAVETTAVGALMLHSALEATDLNISDVTVRHLPLIEHLPAYQAGRIDAMITFEPYASRLQAAGAIPRFDSAAIPGKVVDVLAVRREALRQHDHNLRHLLQGFFRARQDLLQRPEAALAIINQRLKVSAAELPSLFNGLQLPDVIENAALLEHDPSVLTYNAADLAQLMQQQQLLPGVPDLTAFTSAAWLPEQP